jgi:hypothetical protein
MSYTNMSFTKQASKQSTATHREITLGEEEITDVSLAAFHGFDAEDPASRRRQRVVPGGGCGCGRGCGG